MFRYLTTENQPEGTRQRQLGIVMDDRLLSAPNILQPISKQGRITGNFTTEEVKSLVDVLKAGQLPAALTKQPIAKNQIDATLGADTINKGFLAIGISADSLYRFQSHHDALTQVLTRINVELVLQELEYQRDPSLQIIGYEQ